VTSVAEAGRLTSASRPRLRGRAALVTGSSRGTGREIALQLGENGADVAVNYVADRVSAESVVAEIRRMGRRSTAIQADVGRRDDVARLSVAAVDELGPITILVNNAGAGGSLGKIADVDGDEVRRLFELHTFGALDLAQRLLPAMRYRGRGDLIFITSRATRSSPRGLGGYAPSKVATEMIAVILAKEERRHGVRVNVVAPGLVDTDMGRALARDAFKIDDIRALDQRSPFGRVCQPFDVAQTVSFLLAAEYITGEVIYVDGGPD
jgi:3-oxoacyl-[acyl-carrier protein] reductase